MAFLLHFEFWLKHGHQTSIVKNDLISNLIKIDPARAEKNLNLNIDNKNNWIISFQFCSISIKFDIQTHIVFMGMLSTKSNLHMYITLGKIISKANF